MLPYSILADQYNTLHRQEQLEKFHILVQHLHIVPPVLDLGCGTGVVADMVDGMVIGVDICREMIRQCHGFVVLGDAARLPFQSGTFRTIISLTAFHHFDVVATWREIQRVSRHASIGISVLKKSRIVTHCEQVFPYQHKIDAKQDWIYVI